MNAKRQGRESVNKLRNQAEPVLADAFQGVSQFDPDAASKSLTERSLAAVVPMAAGQIPIGSEFLAARDALLNWLGGHRAMQEVRSQAVAAGQSLGMENILGIGIGAKESGGSITGELAVKVFVQEKVSTRRVSSSTEIPPEIEGVPTDVEATGELSSFSYAHKFNRPVQCGVSCGHTSVSAGTIGALVILKSNRLALLSNNHVLANENSAAIGDVIIQPGIRDRGDPTKDVIGSLEAFEPVRIGSSNLVDAAVAWTNIKLVSPSHVTYALDPNPIDAAVLMTVIKNGRTTQATAGWVSAVHVNGVGVQYRDGVASFDDQIIIRSLNANPFSQGGDSGSLIVTSGTKQPIGLLFAGSSSHTVANPIRTVMDRLGIDRFVSSSDS